MPTHKISVAAVIEFLLIIFASLTYFAIRLYPNALSFLTSYPNTTMLLIQLTLGIATIIVVSALIKVYGTLTENEREMHEVVRLFRLIAYPLLILLLLHTIKVPIASLLVGAGFLGIVIGLAAQTTLGNAFAGVSILYANPFKAGEKITFTPTSFGVQAPTHPHETMFTEITGTVRSIGIIYTKLMRDDWSMMYIPNNVLTQSIIQNLSRVSERLLRVRLEVSRDTDIDLFKKMLNSRLSKDKLEKEKLSGLDVKISLMSTNENLGIIITAHVKILDYERLSQFLSENAIKALMDVQKRGRKRK